MSEKFKIAVTIRSFDLASIAENKDFVKVVYTNKTGRHLEEKGLIEAAGDASGIIAGTEKFTWNVLSKLPKLKVISRVGVGTDSIDFKAAKEFGISVCNTPVAPVNAVAEHAMALLLCVLKKICEYNNNIHSGVFKTISGGQLLERKGIGIIGYGRIGKRFSSLVSAFGAKVLWYDPYIESEDGNRVETLEELLKNSDVISLHASPDKAEKPIIGKEELQKCKKGVILINTARGKLIDEDALMWTLDNNIVGGAGLDVFQKEPYGGRLTNYPNVIMTPHISSNVKETRLKMETESVDNLIKELKNCQNRDEKVGIKPNANYHLMGGKGVFSDKLSDPKFAEYRRKWEWNPKQFVVNPFPLHLDIETTNFCNLRCPHCAASYDNWGSIKKGGISFSLFKRIIDEGAENGIYSIKFSFRGEPMLHKNLIKMIQYAKQKGIIDMYFNTNGMLLTKEKGEQLIDVELNRISISADGWDEESFEKNRLGAKFDVVYNNVKMLRELREKRNVDYPRIRIQTVMLPEIKKHLKEFIKLWQPLADELGYLDVREEGPGVDHRGLKGKWACPFLWQRMVILWDGTLLPCLMHGIKDFSLMSLGNVKDVSIKNMWNSEKMNNYRNLHKKGLSHKIGGCDMCSYRAKELEKMGG